jgi:NAD(P)-dependent dehydrogenase (short-subunit alcohol dehydrogenase family)
MTTTRSSSTPRALDSTALVTGATSGIGRTAAVRLAARGHRVAVADGPPSAAKGTVMDFVSVRVITDDVERLATFWEQLTGLPVTRPVPVFAELRTPTGTIAIGAPATVGMLGDAGPVPGQNRSVFVELRVDDVDATWERIKALVPQPIPEIVLEPTDMPWGNRSVILRDPDGGLVNLFTPVTPEAKAKYGL